MTDSQEEPKEQKERGERRRYENFDYEGEERRRALRVKGIVVEYRVRNSGSDEVKGAFLRDLSLDGLSISVTERFELGTLLDFNIYLSGFDEPVCVEAEVRWVKISDYFLKVKKEHFDVGLRFRSVTPEDLYILEKYIRAH